MIADLLPLYIDNACSKSSAEAVEEHLSECPPCRKMYEDMKNCDTIIDQSIAKERDEVIAKQAKFFKRKSAVAGSIIGALFSLPILICLIVNIATGAGLTWFFIVLFAMFIPVSLIVVPLLVPENKLLWTITSFTASLITLLGVCCIYSGGSWFFIAAPAVLFGLSIPFMPFVVFSKPVAKVLKNNKGLTVFSVYTLTYILMMLCIGIKVHEPMFPVITLAFSVPPFAYMWTMFALIRYPKWNGLLKTAACILASALFFFFNDTITLLILGSGLHFPSFDFSLTTTESLNSLLYWLALGTGTVIAAIFAAFGFHKKKAVPTTAKEIISKQ